MFIQINTLCRAGLFLWLTTGLSLSATAEENCTLMTPETTLRIPGGVISAAHHVPVGGVIGETILSDSIDVYQCRIEPGKTIELCWWAACRVIKYSTPQGKQSMNFPVVLVTAWERWRSIRNV